MRISRRTLLASATGLVLSRALPVSALAAEELVVIVHPSNAVKTLDVYELETIFTTSRAHWSGSSRITPFNLPPHSPTRVAFDRMVLRLLPDAVGRFWVDQRVRGRGMPPRQLSDPQLVRRVVAAMPGAIAYVPASFVDENVKVVARIRNGAVIPP